MLVRDHRQQIGSLSQKCWCISFDSFIVRETIPACRVLKILQGPDGRCRKVEADTGH